MRTGNNKIGCHTSHKNRSKSRSSASPLPKSRSSVCAEWNNGALVPAAAQKVATLDPDGDIEDPIGSDITVYKDLAGQLRPLIEKRVAEVTRSIS